DSSATIAMTVPNAALGTPTVVGWFMTLKGVNEATGDDMPDSGASPPFHREAGFSGKDCDAQPFGKSYAVVDNVPAAAAALAASGQPAVRATASPSGVVRFSGDPLAAGAALSRAGIAATVTRDRTLSYLATPNDTRFA